MGQDQGKSKGPVDDDESAPILLTDINGKNVQEDTEFLLHKFSYLGNLEKVKNLLANEDLSGEPLVRKIDPNAGMSCLHNATLGGGLQKVQIATVIIKHDLQDERSQGREPLVNLKDKKGRTALHYGSQSKHVELINKLLNEFNADPNIQDKEGFSPLHILCLQADSDAAVDCAERLLKSPKIKTYARCDNKDNRTALHLAASAMAPKMVKFLLNHGFDHSKKDSRGYTPLMLAASAGDSPEAVACVKELLKVSNEEEINARSGENAQTALHMAASKCHPHVLAMLLEDFNTDIWARDNRSATALHLCTEAWYKTQSLACVKLLVESEKISEWHDKARFLYGDNNNQVQTETPMDICIKHRSIRIAEYLIQAHPTPEAWLDDKMMDRIYKTLPEAIIPLMNSSGLTYNPAKFHERNEAIDAEFGFLTGFKDPITDEAKQETKYLHNVLSSPKEIQRTLLLHPVVQIFIDLKWNKIRPITWCAIGYQFVWLTLYTMMVFEIYEPDCPKANMTAHGDDGQKTKVPKIVLSLGFYSQEDSSLGDCSFNKETAMGFAIVLYFMSIFIVIKEVFQMLNNSNYFKDAANYGQWTILIVFLINTFPLFQNESQVSKWQSYLAAFGIFGAWVLSLREVGKFPNCGIYAAILKKVFFHCLKMLIFYFPLLVAFALCLRILLPGKGQYKYFWFAIVKVVIMMTGELDFDESFYEDDGPNLAANAILGQFVFLLLVFITTIVLLNLLTGLAVNDVQSLIEEAEINRLSNELEQIYLLESLILFIRRKIGLEKCTDFFYMLNVTSTKYSDPAYICFTSKIAGIKTKSYSPDLKKRIKQKMVPDETDY